MGKLYRGATTPSTSYRTMRPQHPEGNNNKSNNNYLSGAFGANGTCHDLCSRGVLIYRRGG